MLDREPFLRAIFADPDNDLPRLVYADWLDDHGDHAWAEYIRVQCEVSRRQAAGESETISNLVARERELAGLYPQFFYYQRGMPVAEGIGLSAPLLTDPTALRTAACTYNPGWYGATRLTLTGGTITTPAQLDTLFCSLVTQNVTTLVLAGLVEEIAADPDDDLLLGATEFVERPVISVRMVEHLCGMREARRLVALDLTRNDLDNDALRALARSTNLIRLTELHLSDGNPRFKGWVWSQVLERFSPEVVR